MIDMESMNPLKLAMLAGEILVQSGAETYRVEDTMNHILESANAEQSNAFAFTTGVFATLTQPGKEAQTLIKRIHKRSLNLSNIATVNDISRRFCRGSITIEDAYRELKAIPDTAYPLWMNNLGMIGLSAGFVLMLGGNLVETFAAGLNVLMLTLFFRLAKRLNSNSFIKTALGAMVITLFAGLIARTPMQLNTSLITVASMMPLVPGSAITNAIRDTLSGDYMSGGSRALEALVIAASIAIGVGLGLTILGVSS